MGEHDSSVQRGIALLDEKGPANWRERIDLETLDLADPYLCVLGQVYDEGGLRSGFAAGRDALQLRGVNHQIQGHTLVSFVGFACDLRRECRFGCECDELTAAWKRALS